MGAPYTTFGDFQRVTCDISEMAQDDDIMTTEGESAQLWRVLPGLEPYCMGFQIEGHLRCVA